MVDKEARVVRIHEIYIKACPAAIWEAIISPEWSGRYGYHAAADVDLQSGGKYVAKANEGMKKFGLPDVIIDGEIICRPGDGYSTKNKRRRASPSSLTKSSTRGGGFCRLTVTHDQTDQPTMAAATISKFDVRNGGGGWNWILSDLKSLLETGKTMS